MIYLAKHYVFADMLCIPFFFKKLQKLYNGEDNRRISDGLTDIPEIHQFYFVGDNVVIQISITIDGLQTKKVDLCDFS